MSPTTRPASAHPERRPSPLRPLAVALLMALAITGACSQEDGEPTASEETEAPAGEAGETGAADDTPVGDPDGTDPLPPLPDDAALPIVFVHGFAGSAQQYESQAMRFVANGYPPERILAYDHDGAGLDIPAYVEGLTEVVDEALETFDVEQVHLVGHSRGTGVVSNYLGEPENAAKVARYVAIDGMPCPDVVPCVAPTQEMFPGQAHVEVATSPESFEVQYEFLVGEEPEVVDIVPQRAPVEISGRAVDFPANTGRDAHLEVWAVDPTTGHRTGDEPHVAVDLGPDGEFGPIELETGAHYEYALTSDDSEVTHHLYLQPYLRSSHLVRLLSSPPDGPTRTNTNAGDDHVALIAIRMREWYAEGEDRDVLELAVDGGDPVDVVADFAGNGTIGLHLHDDEATPGETTLEPLPYFADQPFQSGIDVHLPAGPDGEGSITVTNLPRGDAERPQVLTVPRWPSSGHAVSVVFSDWPVDDAG